MERKGTSLTTISMSFLHYNLKERSIELVPKALSARAHREVTVGSFFLSGFPRYGLSGGFVDFGIFGVPTPPKTLP